MGEGSAVDPGDAAPASGSPSCQAALPAPPRHGKPDESDLLDAMGQPRYWRKGQRFHPPPHPSAPRENLTCSAVAGPPYLFGFCDLGVESRRGRPIAPGSGDRSVARSPRRNLPDTPEQLLEQPLVSIRRGYPGSALDAFSLRENAHARWNRNRCQQGHFGRGCPCHRGDPPRGQYFSRMAEPGGVAVAPAAPAGGAGSDRRLRACRAGGVVRCRLADGPHQPAPGP